MSVYQEPVHQGKTNTLAILSLIAGILSVLLLILSLCIPCGLRIMALIFGAAAAIMGFMAKQKIDESAGAETGRGMAVGGLITGLIGGVGALILLVLFALVLTGSGLLFPFLEGTY